MTVLEHEAKKLDDSEKLVVKVCDISDVGMHNSAHNESKILQKLSCETINKFVAFYEDPFMKISYLVLKNAGEKNLTQFVAEMRKSKFNTQKPLGEVLVKSIMRVLVQTVEYMHRNRIVHRDLKPDNILVNNAHSTLHTT